MTVNACAPRRPLPPRPSRVIGGPTSVSERKSTLTTATTMYREMRMRFWLEQAEAVRDT
jgi:hypothetical protein